MAKVRKDKLGLYVSAGGYVSRPLSDSQYKEGDKPKTKHFGGSTVAGVGKDDTCGRGSYVEYWATSDLSLSDYRDLKEGLDQDEFEAKMKKYFEYYKEKSRVPIMMREKKDEY